MTAIYACWTAASAAFVQDPSNGVATKAFVALIFVYYSFYNLMMPLAYVYTIEVFPYLQRSKGMAIMLLMSRLGSALNVFINPIGLANMGWRIYLVYVCFLAAETTVVYFLYPETFRLSLEDAAKSLENDKATFTMVEGELSQMTDSKSSERLAASRYK
ncbi:unnamed protein product [Clonostachys rosea]|uniref:Major facilitator superfamily (MFS) profile domain-containing protein n=1 Tax=Bionectria ochroleuca TaxID=29856 RepID=A0ABY6UI12_BIOOC|nr:unnamed protein product [Clonostachys rosea]